MNSPNTKVVDKKSKLNLLKNIRGFGSFLNHSTNYWKESFEQNMCSCNRSDIIDDSESQIDSEAKKDLFKVVTEPHKGHKDSELDYQKEWSKEENELLIENYYKNKIKNWKKLSEILKSKSPQQCCYRIKKLEEKAKMKTFTRQDDLQIIKEVELYGKNWDVIAKNLCGFTPTMIEDRYSSKLDPNLKRTKFSVEEDDKILTLYEKFGNNWKEIATYFIDRNSNMIKNRFYSVLKKKVPHSIKSNSSNVDTSSIVTSMLPSIDENQYDYMNNPPQEFNYHMDEDFTENQCDNIIHNHINNDHNNTDIIMSDSNLNHMQGISSSCNNNIQHKLSNIIQGDNESNHSSGRGEDDNMNNNNPNNIPMDQFKEIYQKVFSNDFIVNEYELDYNHEHMIPDSYSYQPFFNMENDNTYINHTALSNEMFNHKNTHETDSLFLESQRLEEILEKIEGDRITTWNIDVFRLSSSGIDNNKPLKELVEKREKLDKVKRILHMKLKEAKSKYLNMKNDQHNCYSMKIFTQSLNDINDILLKLISIEKMRIVLHKQLYDYINLNNNCNMSNGVDTIKERLQD